MVILRKKLFPRVLFLLGLMNLQESLVGVQTHPANVPGIELALDVGRCLLTQVAIQQHAAVTPEDAAYDSKPIFLHALADIVGLVRNGAAMHTLYTEGNLTSGGNIFALSSSSAQLLVDLALHVKNYTNRASYTELDSSKSGQIALVQILSLVATHYSNYPYSNKDKVTDYQESMRNLHAALEALEKLLITPSYVSAQDSDYFDYLFGGIFASNLVRAIYSAGRGNGTKAEPVILSNDKWPIMHADIKDKATLARYLAQHGRCRRLAEIDNGALIAAELDISQIGATDVARQRFPAGARLHKINGEWFIFDPR